MKSQSNHTKKGFSRRLLHWLTISLARDWLQTSKSHDMRWGHTRIQQINSRRSNLYLLGCDKDMQEYTRANALIMVEINTPKTHVFSYTGIQSGGMKWREKTRTEWPCNIYYLYITKHTYATRQLTSVFNSRPRYYWFHKLSIQRWTYKQLDYWLKGDRSHDLWS